MKSHMKFNKRTDWSKLASKTTSDRLAGVVPVVQVRGDVIPPAKRENLPTDVAAKEKRGNPKFTNF